MLDVTIARLVQISRAISRRIDAREKAHRSWVEWQTRNLAMFISQTAFDSKAAKKLVDVAADLSMDAPEERKLVTPHQAAREGFDPEDKQAAEQRAAAKNKVGSFEALRLTGTS